MIALWNLEGRCLHHVIRDAHDRPLLSLHFFAGEALLMSSAGDNSIKQWVGAGSSRQRYGRPNMRGMACCGTAPCMKQLLLLCMCLVLYYDQEQCQARHSTWPCWDMASAGAAVKIVSLLRAPAAEQ